MDRNGEPAFSYFSYATADELAALLRLIREGGALSVINRDLEGAFLGEDYLLAERLLTEALLVDDLAGD